MWRPGKVGPRIILPPKWDKPLAFYTSLDYGDGVDCSIWPPSKAEELEEYNERHDNEEGA